MWGETFCSPIYAEFIVAETMLRKIVTPGLLEARRSAALYDVLAAWLLVDWYGSIKPSTDMLKASKGAGILVDRGCSTNAKISRELTGTKYSKNLQRLLRENKLWVEAMRPRLEFEASLTAPSPGQGGEATALGFDSLQQEEGVGASAAASASPVLDGSGRDAAN